MSPTPAGAKLALDSEHTLTDDHARCAIIEYATVIYALHTYSLIKTDLTMAELHIQEKKGMSWLWWLIGLLLIAAIAWWFFARTDDRDAVVETPAAMVEPDRSVNRITDFSQLATATTAELTGQQVMLTGEPVYKVVSDNGFWIGRGVNDGEALFVVRGNTGASYTPPDGAINAGQTVSVFGVAQSMPADLTQQTADWNLSSTDQSMLMKQQLYIVADSIRIAAR